MRLPCENMKKFIRNRSLSFLVFISLLIAVGVALLSYQTIVLKRISLLSKDEIYDNNEQITLNAAAYFDTKLTGQISALIGIEVAHQSLETDEGLLPINYYETILSENEYISSIEIINLDGIILYSSKETGNREGLDMSAHNIIANADTLYTMYLGEMLYDSEERVQTLEVVYTGANIYILATISTDYFNLYYSELEDSFEDKNIMILNTNGVVIFDNVYDYQVIQFHYTDSDQLIETGKDSITFVGEVFEDESVVSMRELEVSDWYLFVYESTSSAYDLHLSVGTYLSYLFIFFILLFSVIFVLWNYLITHELSSLKSSLELVGSGKFDKMSERTTFKELVQVRTQFNRMSGDLQTLTDALSHAAYHDMLTNLPTKNKAAMDFGNWKSESNSLYFLYFDVTRFAMINDNYGFDVGDLFLVHISEFLSKYFENSYRVEGDEFLCIIKDKDIKEVEEMVEDFHTRLHSGISIQENIYVIPMNIGLSQYPADGDQFYELMQKSMIAMNKVRNEEKEYFCKFKEEFSVSFIRNAKIELILRNALKNDEFYTVYQPISYVSDKRIRGFEALTRWESEELGFVSPVEFIPIMEKTGLITQLDEQVLSRAMKMNKYLCDFYGSRYVMSVNLSVSTIMSERFLAIIDELIEKFNYDPTLLELEITESTIIQDFEGVKIKMDYLRKKGVKFSEDDFGDGYSSLTYLSRLNLDTLKISKNFLSSILDSIETRVLVKTILDLSKSLGFYTIVEGVEDEETFEMFKEFGCDFVQGYLLHRPMKVEKILQLISKELER